MISKLSAKKVAHAVAEKYQIKFVRPEKQPVTYLFKSNDCPGADAICISITKNKIALYLGAEINQNTLVLYTEEYNAFEDLMNEIFNALAPAMSSYLGIVRERQMDNIFLDEDLVVDYSLPPAAPKKEPIKPAIKFNVGEICLYGNADFKATVKKVTDRTIEIFPLDGQEIQQGDYKEVPYMRTYRFKLNEHGYYKSRYGTVLKVA